MVRLQGLNFREETRANVVGSNAEGCEKDVEAKEGY